MDRSSSRTWELPADLRRKLVDYRRAVRRGKLRERSAACLAIVASVFLVLFFLERLLDTPALLRGSLFAATIVALGSLAVAAFYRWYWSLRALTQVAQLMAHRFPNLSDRVLGVIELAEGKSGRASPVLVEAALQQVDRVAADYDFLEAYPGRPGRRWWIGVTLPVLGAIVVLLVAPQAAGNTWQRWSMAWRPIPRYTFTRLADLPHELVVPYAEPMALDVRLAADSHWTPAKARANYAGRRLTAPIQQPDQYRFEIKRPTKPAPLRVAVGDVRETVAVRPVHRPALTDVQAVIHLPDYLQRTEPLRRDIRGGGVTVVRGSRVALEITADRELRSVQSKPASTPSPSWTVHGRRARSTPLSAEENATCEFTWTDSFGIEGAKPFELSITTRDDELPYVTMDGVSSGRIVLLEERIAFQIHAEDDFGTKRAGLEWQVVSDEVDQEAPARRVAATGSPDADTLDCVATFCPKDAGLEPGTIWIRAWAEDYHPEHAPGASPAVVLHVMTKAQHLKWLTEALQKWQAKADEVYDRETALHDTNRCLRGLSPEELDRPEVRDRIERQAAAEATNAARLANVTAAGKQLIKEASKNDQFPVGHLETLAEIVLKLQAIADQKMPSVASLLNRAAKAERARGGNARPAASQQQAAPDAGQSSPGKPGASKPDDRAKPAGAPSINISDPTDESTGDANEKPKSSAGGGRLTLPQNTLASGTKSKGPSNCPAGNQLDQATENQAKLLAEFAAIRDELNKLLLNLEGSTFVKRLKAASRRQFEVADQVERFTLDAFGKDSFFDDDDGEADRAERGQSAQASGKTATPADGNRDGDGDGDRDRNDAADDQAPHQRIDERSIVLERLAKVETEEGAKLEDIRYDMEAFYERRPMANTKKVIDAMQQERPAAGLRSLAGRLEAGRSGESLARAEYWGDTFDRWAEMLVDLASGGT